MEGFSFMNFQLANPWFLLLFLLFIPLLYRDLNKNHAKVIPVPTTQGMPRNTAIVWVQNFLSLSKYLFLALLIVALARPRTFSIHTAHDDAKGLDIFLSVDVSLSMLARDLEPDRLSALRDIAIRFVQKRKNDRLGLVTYSGEALARVPLTIDHAVVMEELANLNPFELEQGTAIGEGLSVAVNHLKNSKAKSKVIILMTDGVNTIENAMDPNVAALLAKDFGIKVYCIGIGTNGYALMPTQTDFMGNLIFTEEKVMIDEDTLHNIAKTTGGKYFRATSNEALEQIYESIDLLEKSEVNLSKSYSYKEYFRPLLIIALLILVINIVLTWGVFRTLR